jgi:transcription elongation factor Elf1
MNVKCKWCGKEQELIKVYKDNLEVFAVCKQCDAMFDIDYDIKTKDYIQIGRYKYVPKLIFNYAEI